MLTRWLTLTPLPQSKKKSKRETNRGRVNKLSLCSTSSPQSLSDVWNSPKVAVCPPTRRTRFSIYTKESSRMHYVCSLCYEWKPNNTPQTCSYGAQFTVDHAMICHMGDFPTIHHNEIRDIRASLLTEVCNNVATKPPLQLLSRGSMTARSANTDDGAHVDIHVRSFWNVSQAFVEGCCLPSHATSCRENQRDEYATLDLDLLSIFPFLGLCLV